MNEGSAEPIRFFHRYNQREEVEAIYGEPFLRWAYGNPLGKLSVETVAKRGLFSHWYGWRMSRPSSRQRVERFIDTFAIDRDEMIQAPHEFQSFNDFFSRRLKPEARPISPAAKDVVFPADGRHLGFQDLSEVDGVFVKGQTFHLSELFQSQSLADRYEKGSAVLSRLCPTDYHRFHFAAAGVPNTAKMIKGSLYSVSPIALRNQLAYLWQNKRMLTIMKTQHLGELAIIEFGATNVGSITQVYDTDRKVEKGSEKGYFSFGGSATMVFFEPNRVQLSADLIENTTINRELYAHMGDCMGTVI